jgi:hypothetical protein
MLGRQEPGGRQSPGSFWYAQRVTRTVSFIAAAIAGPVGLSCSAQL